MNNANLHTFSDQPTQLPKRLREGESFAEYMVRRTITNQRQPSEPRKHKLPNQNPFAHRASKGLGSTTQYRADKTASQSLVVRNNNQEVAFRTHPLTAPHQHKRYHTESIPPPICD